jgi:hypothetical protein
MATSPVELDATAVAVTTDDSSLRVVLADGRELAVPLEWFPRLRDATPEQRTNWRLIGRGQEIPGQTSMRTSQWPGCCG